MSATRDVFDKPENTINVSTIGGGEAIFFAADCAVAVYRGAAREPRKFAIFFNGPRADDPEAASRVNEKEGFLEGRCEG